MQTRMYMVIGTEPGSRPARAAPSSISARLTAMRSGEAQLSSAPSDTSPASLSICGPSAASWTGAGGRSVTPSDADCGHPGAPECVPDPEMTGPEMTGPAVTCWPSSRPRTAVTYSRITAIGRSGRPTDAQNPGP
jgi:hypothetical protein